MSDRKKKEEALRRQTEQLLSALDQPMDKPYPYQEQLRLLYPEVPEPYRPTWQCSDEYLPQNTEWQAQLTATAQALQEAADLCRTLAASSQERTTPSRLILNKNALLHTIHRAEDLLTELDHNYPLTFPRNYQIARSDSRLSEHIPALLLNSPSRILIWLPRLPSKLRGTDSLSYKEFKELLLATDFSHFDKWHCDMVHVNHPRHLLGVLDVDNYLYKPIIDALALAFTSSDSYDRFSCAMYNLSSEKLKPGCYLYIREKDENISGFEDFVLGITSARTP